MYAASYDDEGTTNKTSDSLINRRRTAYNRTQKQKLTAEMDNKNSEKVNSVLHTIQNLPHDMGDMGENTLADFRLPPPPQSAGVEHTKDREATKSSSNQESFTSYDNVDDMYKRFMPDYEKRYPNSQHNMPYRATTEQPNTDNTESANTLLLEKLNYMINLLEEQQDDRTHNVTEEVILYSFLGIFIIFIVDSFVRVGKYVR